MATNITNDDPTLAVVPAPAAINSGALVLVGQAFGVALHSAASAANVTIKIGATAALRKITGASTSFAAGANVHWDATNANATVSATSNLKIGVAVVAAGNTDALVTVRLNPSF